MKRRNFDYQRYLASREWAVLKNQVRERCNGVCERCRRAAYEQTHHLTYERLGHELLEDLLGVCRPCHEYLSAKRDDDPAAMVRADPGLYVHIARGADPAAMVRILDELAVIIQPHLEPAGSEAWPVVLVLETASGHIYANTPDWNVHFCGYFGVQLQELVGRENLRMLQGGVINLRPAPRWGAGVMHHRVGNQERTG